jgi:integrase
MRTTNRIGITTGELTKSHLDAYRTWLQKQKNPRTGRLITAPTVNKHLRASKVFSNQYLEDDDPRPFFRISSTTIKKGLKPVAENRELPAQFSPDELQAFIKAAREHDAAGSVAVERLKNGKVERFDQKVDVAPVFPWAAALMLMGARLGEIAALRWDDIDLEDGIVTFRLVQKTGRSRVLRLASQVDPVSPGMLELLRGWRADRPRSEYVMPERSANGAPLFPRAAWRRVAEAAGVTITPKDLRSNWVSYMAAIGRPAASVALQAGHSLGTLEKHYLALAGERLKGNCLEEAMGVTGEL